MLQCLIWGHLAQMGGVVSPLGGPALELGVCGSIFLSVNGNIGSDFFHRLQGSVVLSIATATIAALLMMSVTVTFVVAIESVILVVTI